MRWPWNPPTYPQGSCSGCSAVELIVVLQTVEFNSARNPTAKKVEFNSICSLTVSLFIFWFRNNEIHFGRRWQVSGSDLHAAWTLIIFWFHNNEFRVGKGWCRSAHCNVPVCTSHTPSGLQRLPKILASRYTNIACCNT
jgi:hypothetical protein